MKNIDLVKTGYSNSQKNYSHDQLMRIVKEIRAYKPVSKEDIVVLSNAHSDESDKDKKCTYSGALVKYHNKQIDIKGILDAAISKPFKGLYDINEILNVIISELSENKLIPKEIQVKLLELLVDNKYPQLTPTIIVVLYKITQKQENSTDDLVNLAGKSGKLLETQDSAINRNILKIIEDAFNKTDFLPKDAIHNLLKLSVDQDCIYRMRDQALNLLLKASEKNQDLGNLELLNSNLNISDCDNDLKLKSLRILELTRQRNNKLLLSNKQDCHETNIVKEVKECEYIKLQCRQNEEIIFLAKKLLTLNDQEKIRELDALSQLIEGRSNLPLEIAQDICALVTNDLQIIIRQSILILDKLVSQGAKVDLTTLKHLANKLLAETINENLENNILDILSKTNEFKEFIKEFNHLKAQSNILLDLHSTIEEKQIAAKSLYEYSRQKLLPEITIGSLKRGLQYSQASSWCIKALATLDKKIEFLPTEIEIIANSLNKLDHELVKAASDILLKSNIDISSINVFTNVIIENKDQLNPSDLQQQLQIYFPHLNVTSIIATELEGRFNSLVLDGQFINQLLSNLVVNDFTQLNKFLDFIEDNVITKQEIIDCLGDKIHIKHLEKSISKQNLEKLINLEFILSPNLLELKDNIHKLIDSNWSLKNVIKLVNSIKLEDQLLFLQGVKFINEYAISNEACSLFISLPSASWQSELHKIAFKTDSDISSIDKNQYTLLKEILSLNDSNVKIKQLVDSNYLSSTIAEITKAYQEDSLILPQGKQINHWETDNILVWSDCIKNTLLRETEHLPEIMAVINRVNYLHTGYEVRLIQMMSVLILLNSKENGRLVQIATGEGKSTITAILASIHSLQGKSVDIITSSPILARRDSEDKANFYKMLGLSCGHNTDKTIMDGVKSCYKSNIVYGDVSNYQFDLLKTEYKRYGTRSDRTFDIAIVDEVDSMLIDEGGKIAKLSSPVFGMEYLEPLLVAVWQQLGLIQSKYTYLSSSDQLLWIEGEFSNENHKLLLHGATSEDDIHIVDDAEKFTTKLLEDYIDSLLQQGAISIPNHLGDFVCTQAKYWAKSAFSAINMEENRNYIIIDEEGSRKVAPVAFDSTGVTQENTQWGDGLHQFLEIKHGLKIKPEGLTSCFISNLGYFRRYGNKIYGMTGTLGSVSAQQLLQNTYNVDYGFIPTYRPKKFQELVGIIEHGKDEWLSSISDNAIREGNNGRACLIISETIADSIEIEEQLTRRGFPSSRIINYYRSDKLSQAEFLENKLNSGMIIVATNLAGRGTDIKTTEELERNGGLHICLTFLPNNLRVEQQAFGRTSRQGNSGTGQLILNSDYEIAKLRKAYPDYKKAESIEEFKEWRDLAEIKRIEDITINQIPKIKLEDGLFDSFKQLAHQMLKQEDNKYKLLQLEELWGLWFKKISHEKNYNIDLEHKAKTDFVEFHNTMSLLYVHGNEIMVNPAYLINPAVNLMNSYDVDKATDLFTRATHVDNKFSFAANYYLAFSLLKQTGSHNSANPEAASKASGYLREARNQITDYIIPAWQSILIMLDSTYNNSLLGNQIYNKIELLQKYIDYIDHAVSIIENAGSDQIVRVKHQTLLDRLYPSDEFPAEEILELNIGGAKQVYEVEAVDVIKEPKGGFFTNFAIAVLGIAQIVIGVALTYATAGFAVKLGAAFISEGIKDLYNSVKATVTGQSLSFKGYWAEKGMSYAIAIAVIGVQSIKDSINAAKQTTLEGGKQLAKEGAKEVTQQSLKERLVDVGKQAVFTIIEQEGSLALARGISSALGNFRNEVKKDAIAEVRIILEQPHMIKALTEIIAIDRFSSNNANQKLLMQKIEASLTPHENKLYNISKRLVNGLSKNNATLKIVSIGMEVGGYAEAIDEFNTILDKFCTRLESIIMEVHQQLPSTHQLLGARLKLFEESSQKLVNSLLQAGIMMGERSFDEKLIGKEFTSGIITNDTSNINKSNFSPNTVMKDSIDMPRNPEYLPWKHINNKVKPKPFEFPDLRKLSTDNISLNEIDFGEASYNYNKVQRQITIDQIRELHKAYSADYSAERERLAQNLGQAIGGNMIRKLQTGLIQPASSVIASAGVQKISTLLTEHNRKVRLESSAKQTKIITIGENGVITSDDKNDNNRHSESAEGSPGISGGSDKLQDSGQNNSKNQKSQQIKLRDIEKQLEEQYPALNNKERQKLALEIYNLEKQWQRAPVIRPGIQMASSSGITSDVPLFTLPSARSQAIDIVINKYSNTITLQARDNNTLMRLDKNIEIDNELGREVKRSREMFGRRGNPAIDKFIRNVFSVFGEQYQQSLQESERQRGISSLDLFESRSQEIDRDVLSIRQGQGPVVFKAAAEFNKIVGGTFGYLFDQVSHTAHVVDPGSKALWDASFGTVGRGLVGTIEMTLPPQAISALANSYKKIMGYFPDKDERFLVETSLGLLGGQFIGNSLKMAMVNRASVSSSIPKALTPLKPTNIAYGEGFTKIHKNSHNYIGDTHVYRILDKEGKTYKIGESARGVRKDGRSIRAEQQARKLHEQTGEKFETEIRKTFKSKKEAYDYENNLIKKFKALQGDQTLPGNKNNH